MTGFSSVDWTGLFNLSLSPAEIMVRATVMYWFLFLVFRFVVRRDIGAVGIADVLVLVIIADAAQNAMSGDYKTISDGMILVATLVFWNVLLDWLSFRFTAFHRFAVPHRLLLVKNGRLLKHNMRREFISEEELWSKLHQAHVDSLEQIKAAYMEADGQITVLFHESAVQNKG